MLDFVGWPKIARLNRDIIVTEKINGTNAAIVVLDDGIVYAQSRTRVVSTQSDNYGFARWVEQHKDALREFLGVGRHHGEWWGVGIQSGYDLSERRFSLFNTVKWTDSLEGQLALSNLQARGVAVHAVPTLYKGPWTANLGYKDANTGEWLRLDEQENWIDVEGTENPRPRFAPNFILEWLKRAGSQAAPGYMTPEGIVVYHRASDTCFKVLAENDQIHKGEV